MTANPAETLSDKDFWLSDDGVDWRAKDTNQRYAEVLRRHVSDDDVINQLGVFQRRMYFTKAFAHWEIYKQVADLPGDVVECGVYKGDSLFNFARFVEMLSPGERSKIVYGFDHFQGLSEFTDADRTANANAKNVGSFEGAYDGSAFYPSLKALVDLFNQDSFVPKKPRIKLVEGAVRESAPQFVADNPGLRIALLHLDCDIYEPTLAALEAFYPHVVPGGVVILDEYGFAEFPGESKAVEEYFGGAVPRIEKFGWTATPGGWFVKD